MTRKTPPSLLNNSRFYILCGTILASGLIVAILRQTIASDQLFYIRTEQIFGLGCILFWYLALIISPLGYVLGKERIRHLSFARRAIGVSAAYLATLHVIIALWGQLGGPHAIPYLPSLFRWSLLAGVIALVILLAMTATSFDGVIKFMTFRRWKWLHRFVYGAGILAVLHVWSIGTHTTYTFVRVTALMALIILSGLEMFRITQLLAKKYHEFKRTDYFTAFFVSSWAVWIALILALPAIMQTYHTDRTDQNTPILQQQHAHNDQGNM